MSQTPQHVASPSWVACNRCGYSRNTDASRCAFCGSDRLLGAGSSTPHLGYVPLRGVGSQTTRALIVAGIVLLALIGVVSAQIQRAQGEARAVAAATATAAAVQAQVALANAHVDEAERQASAGQLAAAFSELDQASQGQPSLARAASLRQDVSARVTATALVQATQAAVAAEGARSAQAHNLLAEAQTQRDAGDLAAALASVTQALALTPDLSDAVALKNEVGPAVTATAQAVSASATAQTVAASATASANAAIAAREKKWNEFLNYGPQLVKLLRQSDEINRNHSAAAARLTTANAAQFYTLTDRSAQATGNLKISALGMSTPPEGRDLKDSVYQTLRLREDAFNKLKAVLDAPGRLSLQADYQEAKRLADISAFPVVAQLFELCGTMDVGPDECNSAVGLGE
jgi:hypothetical protein